MKKITIAQLSFLIACGSALQLAESFIPFPIPIPGVKIGLSNITTLLGLVLFGIPAAFEISVFRPLITSLTNGTFLSPGLVLSLCGSVVSCAVMALVYMAMRGRRFHSVIALSVIGAVTHNAAEIVVGYYWLLPHKAVIALAPFMIFVAMIGGYLVGWSARYVLERMEQVKLNTITAVNDTPDDIPLTLPEIAWQDKFKVVLAFLLVLSTVFLRSTVAYGILIFMVLVLIVVYRETMALLSRRMLRLWLLIVGSFAIPVLFSPAGGDVLWQWAWFTVTMQGVMQGVLFSLRLIFLILISIWIGVDEPSKLSEELAWILSPLKYLKFSVNRIPRVTSLSLSFIPVIWEKLTHVKPKTLKNVLNALVVVFVGLEQEIISEEQA